MQLFLLVLYIYTSCDISFQSELNGAFNNLWFTFRKYNLNFFLIKNVDNGRFFTVILSCDVLFESAHNNASPNLYLVDVT